MVPISQNEFKAFFHKTLGDFRVFLDSYWVKIKYDSQYQLEKMLDWTVYLKQLQAILKECNVTTAPNKNSFIRYFQKRAQLDNQGRKLDA